MEPVSFIGCKKILIVSLGSMGKRYIQIIRNLFPEVSIGVLRHRKYEDNIKESFGVEYCFTSIEDALAYQPDAAILANPSSMHIDVGIPLADAGIHLLIEKPIAASVKGVKKLIDLCIERKIVLMTAYNLRFLSSLNQFRSLLHGGKIGEVYSVRSEVGTYLPGWRPDQDYTQTVSAQERLGGGVLLELSHEIDYLQWIFGLVKWVNASVSRQSKLEIDVEDTAHMILGFGYPPDKKQLIASLNMDFFRHDPTRRCTAIGQKGSLRWDGLDSTIHYFPADAKNWEVLYTGPDNINDTYMEEVKHFFNCVQKMILPLISGTDGLRVLKVIEAAKKSSETGTLVLLD